MGTDATLFAIEAKKAFYFDRLYNFCTTWENGDWERADSIRVALLDVGSIWTGVPAADVQWLAEENLRGWTAEEDKHRAWYNRQILAFVAMYPTDRFFVRPDNTDPEYYGFLKKYGGDYEEVEPLQAYHET